MCQVALALCCAVLCMLFNQSSSFQMNVKNHSVYVFFSDDKTHTHRHIYIYIYIHSSGWFNNADHSFLAVYLFIFSRLLHLGNWQPIHFSENDAKFNWIANKHACWWTTACASMTNSISPFANWMCDTS